MTQKFDAPSFRPVEQPNCFESRYQAIKSLKNYFESVQDFESSEKPEELINNDIHLTVTQSNIESPLGKLFDLYNLYTDNKTLADIIPTAAWFPLFFLIKEHTFVHMEEIGGFITQKTYTYDYNPYIMLLDYNVGHAYFCYRKDILKDNVDSCLIHGIDITSYLDNYIPLE